MKRPYEILGSTKTSDRDVLTVVSGHVETVILMSKVNPGK